MTKQENPSQLSRLYKLYRLLVLPAILWYLWNTQYIFTANEGVEVVYAMWGRYFIFFAAIPVCIILGIAIMRQRSGNVIGPALIVYVCALSSEVIFDLALPATQASLNLFIIWTFMWTSSVIIYSHYPSSKLYPRRLAPILYLLIIVCLFMGVMNLLGAPVSYGSDIAYAEPLTNPFLIESLALIGQLIFDIKLVILEIVSLGGFLFALIRYFLTTPVERKQMRWMIVGFFVASFAIGAQETANLSDDVVFISTFGLILVTLTLPISIGVGVLFYNLWDVDVIIRRTLIYAVVSALLVLTYFAIVLTTQTLLSGFIPEDNTLLIVVSTLVIAALFNPVLQRVQRVIDRLFYRKRYNAETTLDQFSEKIRDAMDAQAIENHIVDTVTTTIQPETISLWIVKRQNDIS